MSELQDLKNKVFKEPSTKVNRYYLVKYIKLQIEEAKLLPKEERLASHGEGWDIAGNIAGAIAHNCADEGVEHDNWLNEQTEPVLFALLQVSGALDINGNQPQEWKKLFELGEKLN